MNLEKTRSQVSKDKAVLRFTGASDKGKVGLFELAGEGTLFLDEIGELPITVQAKLLKCLDEKEIMHLGGLAPISIKCTVRRRWP